MISSSSIERSRVGLACLAAALFFAATGNVQADIYDSLAALSDSLDAWVTQSPTPWLTPAETLDMASLFPGAQFEWNEERGEITIRQPLYLQLLRTELAFKKAAWHDGQPELGWRLTSPEAATETEPAFLLWLRTCGLPANLAAPAPDGEALVELVLQGRHPRRWTLPLGKACSILAHLAEGSQVYAGVMTPSVIASTTDEPGTAPEIPAGPAGTMDISPREYYLLWTHPEVSGHHFLIWSRQLQPALDKLLLVPFIPTANLAELFSTSPERDPVFQVHREQ